MEPRLSNSSNRGRYSLTKRARGEHADEAKLKRAKAASQKNAKTAVSQLFSPGALISPPFGEGRSSRTVLNRELVDIDVARMNFFDRGGDVYSDALASTIFPTEGCQQSKKVLQVIQQEKIVKSAVVATLPIRRNRKVASVKQVTARAPQVAERVLDAPCIVDDYHLCLIDWSTWANTLAVSLNDTVYTWDAATGVSNELLSLEDDSNPISCVKWIQEGGVIGLGTSNNGLVKLWDATRGKRLRQMTGHTDRVCTMEWNQHIITTGSRDGTILHHDVRVKKQVVGRIAPGFHKSEICTVTYNQDYSQFASTDDDGVVCIWDASPASRATPITKFQAHSGPVKAIDWYPRKRHVLCTGGFSDQNINLWKTNSAAPTLLSQVSAEAELTSLRWSQNTNELVTSSGHPSNLLAIWSHHKDKLKRTATYKGHRYVY